MNPVKPLTALDLLGEPEESSDSLKGDFSFKSKLVPDWKYNPGSTTKSSKLTIAQIIKVCWPAYIKEKLSGKNFNSWSLNKLEANGNLKVKPLGPSVPGSSKGVQELCVGISWTTNDDHLNMTENQKVSFVLALMNNAVDTHDATLLKEIGTKHAIVSKEYKYMASEVQEDMYSTTYHMKIYTAFAVLDSPKSKPKLKMSNGVKPKSKSKKPSLVAKLKSK